ncbi:hypothetical protein CLOSTHATH_05712 [Hungatella hathewayi DSM 13479]|uniref:Uncharacterized protein n=1 Tax=Hungatella hathewayi DSM 13479 TaxID=566550 RepID=D3AQ06_9FIRM|nr:hypothetical protein CLOSTHATH_05712 [Hungatella hathewayi DSM 13479]
MTRTEKSVSIWRKFMNFGQISGHLPGFAHFQKPGFDQQKPSIYAGLRAFCPLSHF